MARKKGKDMICTSECAECVHSDINPSGIKLRFYCEQKNKTYTYGQYVPCDSMEKQIETKRKQK